MPEVKEVNATPSQQTATPAAPRPTPPRPANQGKKKMIKRLIALGVTAAIVAGLGFGMWYLVFRDSSTLGTPMTAIAELGSIQQTAEGYGTAVPKESASITLSAAGTVQEVLVTEGQQVTAGTPLFVIDSDAARKAVEKARTDVEGYEKKLSTLQKDIAGLNLAPTYSGKLMECVTLNPGDPISKDQKLATLADDTRLRLEQYYSYAYAGDLKVGQTVNVSVPALMSSLTGTVEAVHMVSRITPEGSKLFSAEIVVKNDGALTADMAASATVTVNGETVYPYEPGKLEYYRVGDLKSTVSGTVISSNLVDYLQVSAGQVLVRIDGEESESEIFSVQQSLEEARKALETAQKNLDNCNAVAPIDGTVIDYPVVRTGDPDYYLNHTFSGRKSYLGTLFSLDGTDYETPGRNIGIYGHHIRSSGEAMFSPLLSYKDPEFCAAHAVIYLDSLYHSAAYRVFAAVNLRSGEWDPATARFAGDEDFLAFVRRARAQALYDTGIEPDAEDEILTLITCDRSYSDPDGRLVVMAVREY